MSSKGISLHIGVNVLDPAGYPLYPPDDEWPNGWDGPLQGCHSDAEAMCAIAKKQGFDTRMLLSGDATVDKVTAAIRQAAAELKAGDTFLITFAGHGGQIPDVTGDEAEDGDEFDTWDETWCLHDRHFIDDEQQVLYSEFEPDVRIIIVSDSCHSGTIMRDNERDDEPGSRTMPRGTVHACYHARKKEYDDLQRNAKRVRPGDIGAKIVLISACQENEIAGDGTPNGQFTGALLSVWKDGDFTGTYKEFHEQIVDALDKKYEADNIAFGRGDIEEEPIHQTPNLNHGCEVDKELLNARPFSF
jgi:hypothetical protein